ncbi:MAG: fasciclin domain-containing protein [Bacteroidales bacterium]
MEKISILGLAFFLLLIGCKEDWNEHFDSQPETSNVSVWDALQKDAGVSDFVNYMKQYKYDTLFLKDNTYTLFVPTNEAFSQFLAEDSVTLRVMNYLIAPFFVQSVAIIGNRKIQTLAEKYSLFSNTTGGLFLDDAALTFESPLYRNGKYFIMSQVAKPRPNLYEYISETNPVLKAYIDSQDSIEIDMEKSIPKGFDENGNTIYDTVPIIRNMFEEEFFAVSEEYRFKTATIVFPKEENYNSALTLMAQSMNAGYTDYTDIPMEWQQEILIPYLLEHGVFATMLEREEFLRKTITDTVRLMNILGDSVDIDYQPGEKTICSNGYAYNYSNFKVPDTLYNTPYRFEAEELLKTYSSTVYVWEQGVTVTSSQVFKPMQEYIQSASNDTVIRVSFPSRYTGQFNLKFNLKTLFPRRYLMVFRTIMRIGGLYEIYVNDQLVKTFDYAVYNPPNSGIIYSVTGVRYRPSSDGYNRFDCWLDVLETYGQAKIRIEYKGPSNLTSNGLVLDYIDFVPYD